jgi:hypothetical protein
MTDHDPALLPSRQSEPARDIVRTITLSKSLGSAGRSEHPRRSAHWAAASGRWMDRSFDPTEAEAIREHYRSIPAVAEDEEA